MEPQNREIVSIIVFIFAPPPLLPRVFQQAHAAESETLLDGSEAFPVGSETFPPGFEPRRASHLAPRLREFPSQL